MGRCESRNDGLQCTRPGGHDGDTHVDESFAHTWWTNPDWTTVHGHRQGGPIINWHHDHSRVAQVAEPNPYVIPDVELNDRWVVTCRANDKATATLAAMAVVLGRPVTVTLARAIKRQQKGAAALLNAADINAVAAREYEAQATRARGDLHTVHEILAQRTDERDRARQLAIDLEAELAIVEAERDGAQAGNKVMANYLQVLADSPPESWPSAAARNVLSRARGAATRATKNRPARTPEEH